MGLSWGPVRHTESQSHPDPLYQSPLFDKIARGFTCILKLEEHWSRQSLYQAVGRNLVLQVQ